MVLLRRNAFTRLAAVVLIFLQSQHKTCKAKRMGEPPAASKERELIFEFDVFDDGPIGTGENTNAESVSSILPSISSMPTTSSSTSSTSTEIPPHLNTVSDAPSISLAPSELQSAESSLLPSTVSDFPSFVPSQAPTSIGPFGTIEYVGNEGTFYSPYPLGICKGDCDTDEDCAEGLVCHQRSGFGPVPGCDGGETTSSTADFCVWNGTGSLPAPEPQPTNGTFRLKLYWEEGYEWQGETFEREWCMMFNYTGYPGTNRCWIRNFTVPCNESQAYTAKCVTGEPRQWFRFVELGSPNGEPEVLIQTGDQLRCFERMNRELWLRECNESNPRQRWFALNGSFDGPRFEISQLGFTSQCIANDHHPKSGEVMELHWCEGSRWEEDQTSYWNKY